VSTQHRLCYPPFIDGEGSCHLKFKVTLFGQNVEELFVAAGETDKIVVVVLLAKVKIYQSNSFSLHHLFSFFL